MLKVLRLMLMAKKTKEQKAEEEANRLLDEFVEKYAELHDLIHHREDEKEQKKLERDFADVFYKDSEVQSRLAKFVEFVNDQVSEDGNES